MSTTEPPLAPLSLPSCAKIHFVNELFCDVRKVTKPVPNPPPEPLPSNIKFEKERLFLDVPLRIAPV